MRLQDAVTNGWFRAEPHSSGGPNLPVVTATITEIALGMEFLHSQGIVHGDLSSGMAHSHTLLRPALPAATFHISQLVFSCGSLALSRGHACPHSSVDIMSA